MAEGIDLAAVLALVTFLFGISYMGMAGIWKSISELKQSVNGEFTKLRERVARLEERCGQPAGEV